VSGAAVIADDFVYIFMQRGVIEALNLPTGIWKWTSSPDRRIPIFRSRASAPAVAWKNGHPFVYFTSGAVLYALNGETGGRAWEQNLPASPTTAPIATPQNVVYVTTGVGLGAELLAINNASAPAILWRAPTGSVALHTAVDVRGRVYVATQTRVLRFN
jgi:outer membrane protein assembly factor BamB